MILVDVFVLYCIYSIRCKLCVTVGQFLAIWLPWMPPVIRTNPVNLWDELIYAHFLHVHIPSTVFQKKCLRSATSIFFPPTSTSFSSSNPVKRVQSHSTLGLEQKFIDSVFD
jgi:hypothetical protein